MLHYYLSQNKKTHFQNKSLPKSNSIRVVFFTSEPGPSRMQFLQLTCLPLLLGSKLPPWQFLLYVLHPYLAETKWKFATWNITNSLCVAFKVSRKIINPSNKQDNVLPFMYRYRFLSLIDWLPFSHCTLLINECCVVYYYESGITISIPILIRRSLVHFDLTTGLGDTAIK